MYDAVKAAALELKEEGVRAITGDCGFMALFQHQLAQELGIPVFLSSLLQLPFMGLIVGPNSPIGVVTANKKALIPEVFTWAGVSEDLRNRLVVRGLEDDQHFVDAVFAENGMLDSDIVETAVVQRAVAMQQDYPDIGAILLECSMLPPYGAAVSEATGLPVFDYVTMIDYVHATVVKRRFQGHM
jgi:Asp/Glu/hydantoin racemase